MIHEPSLAVLVVVRQQPARDSSGKQVSAGQVIVLPCLKSDFSPATFTRVAGTMTFLIFAHDLPTAPVFHLQGEHRSLVKEMNGKKGQIRTDFIEDLTPCSYSNQSRAFANGSKRTTITIPPERSHHMSAVRISRRFRGDGEEALSVAAVAGVNYQ